MPGLDILGQTKAAHHAQHRPPPATNTRKTQTPNLSDTHQKRSGRQRSGPHQGQGG